MPRTPRTARTCIALILLAGALTGSRVGQAIAADGSSVMDTSQSPAQTAGVPIPPGQVDRAIQQLDDLAIKMLQRTHIPGLAIAVVQDGKTVYAKGFGIRRVGGQDRVNADTVFQIASLSKSVGATVVARAVGQGIVAWDTPVVRHLPWFALADSWVTDHVTIGDLFAHRSGLPDHAGDDLEDLGHDRRGVLERLRFLPLHPFRSHYAYTNFGLTAAAESVAVASGKDWATLAEEQIYTPLGMASTSSRFTDYQHRTNRASGHVRTGPTSFLPKYTREPDAQSPAGGVSSSVNDMARWMSMVLGGGVFEGTRIVKEDALLPAVTGQVISQPSAAIDARAGLYGYGFGIGTAPSGRATLSHSGAFSLGAATNYVLIPSIGVGIVVLSNAVPIGAVETLGMEFADLVQFGAVTRDWLSGYARMMAGIDAPSGALVGKAPPAHPVPPASLPEYVGTYTNEYYGEVKIALGGQALTLTIGPKSTNFSLRHWNGQTFAFDILTESASAGSVSSVTFAPSPSGRPSSLRIEVLSADGTGVFTRR